MASTKHTSLQSAASPSCNKICKNTVTLFGDRFVLLIINALASGGLRFCELQRSLNMLNPSTLSNRLQILEEKKLIIRTTGSKDELSVTYSLAPLGKEALKVLEAIHVFSKKLV